MIEMLIVITLIGLLAGLTYPSVSSGLSSLRLRAAADSIGSFLTTAVDRAERRQQTIEIVVSPASNTLTARAADLGFAQRLEVPAPVRIVAVHPALVNDIPNEPRRFLIYPGGAAPRIGIEIANPDGRRRMVTVDPLTGFPRTEAP
jgi:type II secretory pathway pseudopilin PulG